MKKIAVFTSGGDAPGMNACIRAVVRGGLYHGISVMGIEYGYRGMIEGRIKEMKSKHVSNIIQKGGTILKSVRCKEFLTKEGREKAYQQLLMHEIEGLIVIGGNGSFTGAKVFYDEYNFPIVGVPGTIDNDIYGSDFTIGFDTAVNTATGAIDKIRDTADSHDRLFFVEVMGRDSGYIANRTAVCVGAEMVLLPETTTSIEGVVRIIRKNIERLKTFGLIVVAEGISYGSVNEIASNVQKELSSVEIRVVTLGHIQRGGSPTSKDRILATRMGYSALEGLMSGRKNVMAGIINDNLVYTDFEHAITIKKTLSKDLSSLTELLS